MRCWAWVAAVLLAVVAGPVWPSPRDVASQHPWPLFGANTQRTSSTPHNGGLPTKWDKIMKTTSDPICVDFDVSYTTAFVHPVDGCGQGVCMSQKLPLITMEGIVIATSLIADPKTKLLKSHIIRLFDTKTMSAIRDGENDLMFNLSASDSSPAETFWASNASFEINSFSSTAVVTAMGMYVTPLPIAEFLNGSITERLLVVATDVTRTAHLPTRRWQRNFTVPPKQAPTCTLGLTSDLADPVLHCANAGLYRLNQRDGSTVWHRNYSLPLQYNYLPAAHDGRIYFILNCSLAILNETDGVLLANVSLPEMVCPDHGVFGNFEIASLVVEPFSRIVVLQTKHYLVATNGTHLNCIPTPQRYTDFGGQPLGIGFPPSGKGAVCQAQDKGFQYLNLARNLSITYDVSGTTLDPVYSMPALMPNSTTAFISIVQSFVAPHICRTFSLDRQEPILCCDVTPTDKGMSPFLEADPRAQITVSPADGLWYFRTNQTAVDLVRVSMRGGAGGREWKMWYKLAVAGGAMLCAAWVLSLVLVVPLVVYGQRVWRRSKLAVKRSQKGYGSINAVGGEEWTGAEDLVEIAKGEQWFLRRGDVHLDRVVGSGAKGTVWQGRWRGTEVAVKRLKMWPEEGGSMDAQDVRTFAREMSLLSRLRHPNIIAFRGAVMDLANAEYAIVLEYHPSGNLYDYIGEPATAAFGTGDALGFVQDIAQGMAFLHDRDPPVLHRDLKSPNLLVTDRKRIVITDFGLSRFVPDVTNATLTEGMGTIVWMAPELLMGESYDEKVDVYSFGIVLWELLTRERPFGAMNKYLVASQVIEGQRPSLSPALRETTCAELIARCWAQRPEDRPSFDDVVAQVMLWNPDAFGTVMEDEEPVVCRTGSYMAHYSSSEMGAI